MEIYCSWWSGASREILSSWRHAGQGEISIVIWTTTPWTLPAIAQYVYSDDLEYVLIQVEANGDQPAQRIVVASELAKDVMDRAGIEHAHNLGFATGADLELSQFNHRSTTSQFLRSPSDHSRRIQVLVWFLPDAVKGFRGW